MEWINCKDQMPKHGVLVETKIDDEHGVRNVCKLILYQRDSPSRKLWFTSDMSMYVYYSPTHWKPV